MRLQTYVVDGGSFELVVHPTNRTTSASVTMDSNGGNESNKAEEVENYSITKDATKKMETLEIETECQLSDGDLEADDAPTTPSFDEDDEGFDDMERLLGGKKATKRPTGSTDESNKPCCVKCHAAEPEMTMGNVKVPSLYVYGYTGGWGVVGPHWFGPPCVFGIIVLATYYFAYHESFRKKWYWTSAFCFYLSVQTTYFLLSAAYRDAGVVREGRLNVPNPVPRNFRWCETCNYYQPPTTLHCPDCNTCVLGFDHHCVWMGNCIGVGKPAIGLSMTFYISTHLSMQPILNPS